MHEDWKRAKLQQAKTVSVDDLFKRLYKDKYDKLRFDEGEKLKLINKAISRLEYDLNVAMSGLRQRGKELEKLRQARLF